MMSMQAVSEIRQKLEASRSDLRQFLDTLTPDQWETTVFADGDAWTLSDLLRHINRAEYSMIRLMDNIRQGGGGASADFDLNRWNASGVRKSKEKPVAELLVDMEANRAYLWEFVDSLSEQDLMTSGRHGSGQILTVAQILEVIAGHDRQHLTEMRQALAN